MCYILQANCVNLRTAVIVKIVTIVSIGYSYSNSRTEGANGRLVEPGQFFTG